MFVRDDLLVDKYKVDKKEAEAFAKYSFVSFENNKKVLQEKEEL